MTIKAGAALLVAVVVSGSGLSGCGGPPPSSAGPVVAPSSVSGPGTTARPDDAPQASQSGQSAPEAPLAEGEQQSTGPDRLPEGFPVEQIPIVVGKVLGGSRGRTGGPYTVLVRVPGKNPAELIARITTQFAGAGFAVVPGISTPTASAARFQSTRYDVGVNVIRNEGRTTVTYVVLQIP